jgi:hypothetical protein
MVPATLALLVTAVGVSVAGRVLAAALAARGEHADAADVYAEVVAGLAGAGDRGQASLTTAPLALAVHAAGRCNEAIRNLTAVWDTWQAEYGILSPFVN